MAGFNKQENTVAKTDEEIHQECMQRFIQLANEMKQEDTATPVISSGLMTASAVYAIYAMGGNAGLLNAAGIDKVTEAYRQQLEQVQLAKRERQQKRAESGEGAE